MKIYLAARYSRREELCKYRDMLEGTCCHKVTSRWLHGNHQADDSGLGGEESAARGFAEEDSEDLRAADAVISFTEEPRKPSSTRGGRHVEFGMGLALGKHLAVIGYRENVFHCLKSVFYYPSWDSFWELRSGFFWDHPKSSIDSDSILDEAQRLVHGPRGDAYGHPLDDYTRTAAMMSAILGHEVSAEQAIRCMIAVKLSRECNKPKRDNRVDMAGYAECLQMVADRRAAKE